MAESKAKKAKLVKKTEVVKERTENAKAAASNLGNTLDALRDEALRGCCFDAAAVITVEGVDRVRAALQRFGVVFLTNAMAVDSVNRARGRLNDAMWSMFHYNLEPAGIAKPASLRDWNTLRNSANGFGNASFSYINKQFTAAADTPHTCIGKDERVYMTTHCIWTQVNLPLLLENPHTCALLLALTHVSGMVSIDSAKYASNPRPKPKPMTKETLTEPHVDIYSSAIRRRQALLVVEGRVKLGFVVGTHKLLKEMAAVTENDAFLRGSGYIACCDEDLKNVLHRGWIAPLSGSLVIWNSGVVHFEATSQASAFGPHVFRSWSDTPDQERLRFVVGTHLPVGLSQKDLIQMGVMAECGAIPDFYRKINKHCAHVYPNIVNAKSTQYLVPRKLEAQERAALKDAMREGDLGEEAAAWKNMPLLKRHLMGISQPMDELPFDESDKLLLKAAPLLE